MDKLPTLRCDKTTAYLISFIKEVVFASGFPNAVIGLSGGVDSAVVAALLTQALGKEHVFAYSLPYTSSNPIHATHAADLSKLFGFPLQTIAIDEQLDLYFSRYEVTDPVRRGNKMARERMSILFDQAKVHNALVAGTSNKTETLLGYGTWFGDTAWSFNPIGDIYKTHISQLAHYLEIPDVIINKPPSADLWEGQTDEQELGFPYSLIDTYLYLKFDLQKSTIQLEEDGFNSEFVSNIELRINSQSFKRVGGRIASVPLVTFAER